MGDRRDRRCAALGRELADLIVSEPVRSIAFILGGVMITQRRWTELATALSAANPVVHVEVDRHGLRKHKALGKYNISKDTITLKSFRALQTVRGRGTAVHECVHAIADGNPRAHVTKSDNEAAGVLAKYWYYMNVNRTCLSAAGQKLVEIARSTRDQEGWFGAPASVDPIDVERLKAFYYASRDKAEYADDADSLVNNDGWAG
jgi:hypothetical protein